MSLRETAQDRGAIRALLLVGHSNAGKSPLGAALERYGSCLSSGRCRWHHLDFGELLRRTIAQTFDPPVDAAGLHYLRSVMDGRLLDDEHFYLAGAIVNRFLETRKFDYAHDVLILNGMPRHCGQARDCAAMGIDVRLVIYLRCDLAIALQRSRLASEGCGHEDRSRREDGGEEILRRRAGIFEREIGPLLEYYRSQAVPFANIEVDVGTTPAEMVKRCQLWLASLTP